MPLSETNDVTFGFKFRPSLLTIMPDNARLTQYPTARWHRAVGHCGNRALSSKRMAETETQKEGLNRERVIFKDIYNLLDEKI